MSNFTLPEDSLIRLAAQVNMSGTFGHVVRSAYSRHQVMFKLHIERSTESTEATVEMGEERHHITLQSNDPERHIHLADFIDAIANGRVDSAAPAPARVTRFPVLPEPEPLLDADQDAALQLLVRKGGTLDLHLGHEHPVRVAIHRTHSRSGITAILSIGETRPRTSCFTAYGMHHSCYERLLKSVEHLAACAAPKVAA